MSTKTLRKRIALAAVTALGAGLLSVVSTPAAIATANNAVGSNSNAGSADGILNIATVNSVSGATTLGANGIETGTTSLGLLANSTTQDPLSLTSTATLRSDGAASFYSKIGTAKVAHTIAVTGGTVSAYTLSGASGDTATVNSNVAKTKVVFAALAASNAVYNFTVTPDAGVTTVQVALSIGTAALTLDSNDIAGLRTAVAGVQAGTTSAGTLSQRYTITIGSAAASGVYSPTFSVFQMATSDTETVDGIDDLNSITGSATTIPNGVKAQINWSLKDAFGQALPAGAIAISTTAGGLVDAAALGTIGTPLNTVDVATDATGSITIGQAVANTPATVTVTATRNGVSVGSKTISFLGEVAKVTVTPAKIGKSGGGNNVGAATIAYADAAGNVLYPTTETSTVVAASLGLSTVVSNAVVSRNPAATPVSGLVDVTCQAAGTVAALQMRHVNSASGTVVLSNTWSQACAGVSTSVTASFDKATYAPGTIATLTLTFKDSKGNLANAYDLIETMTITGAPSVAPVTPLVEGSSTASGLTGSVVLQYVVGSITGDFIAVVVPSATLKTNSAATQANLSVSYKVAASGTTVTNEQVLASIVSLIASINKQIVALQKLILKRR
jgi:trimeric autotransporter adhesin